MTFHKDFNSVNGVDSSFGDNWRKGCHIRAEKELEAGATLFLVSCFDKYEDGYCVFACNERNEVADPNRGRFVEFKIIEEVQFRGNSEYPSEYSNQFAGEKTFAGINKLEDFELLKSNRYAFI